MAETNIEVKSRNSGSTLSKPAKSPMHAPLTSAAGGNLVSDLLDQNEALTERLIKCEEEERVKKSQIAELTAQLDELRLRLNNVDQEAEEIERKSANKSNNKTAEEIQSYLATYERLKSDERQFKEMCNNELERLQNLASQGDAADAPQAEVLAQLQRAKARVEAGRSELSSINMKLATLKRQVDQVPNRTELREYRLRFVELYNQVSATHRQTKQFFSLYNSLEDTKRYLEKELSLLNSIVDSYQQACTSPAGRESFLRQLSSLHEGMKDTCSKVDKTLSGEKISVEKMQHELQRLLDQKVSYEKCLKELESECKANDKLLAMLKQNDPSQQK